MNDLSNIWIRMHGEYDIADRDRVHEAFDACIPAPFVVVDLSQAKYVDSSVLGAFIHLRNQRIADRPNAIGFIEPGAALRRLIEIAGLASVFPFFENLDDAAKHFGIADRAFKSVDV